MKTVDIEHGGGGGSDISHHSKLEGGCIKTFELTHAHITSA